jgi:hypothetical protein
MTRVGSVQTRSEIPAGPRQYASNLARFPHLAEIIPPNPVSRTSRAKIRLSKARQPGQVDEAEFFLEFGTLELDSVFGC